MMTRKTPVMVRFFISGFGPAASRAAADETDQRKDEENDEANLGNPCGGTGDAGKAEDGRDERHDKENNGIVKHGMVGVGVCGLMEGVRHSR